MRPHGCGIHGADSMLGGRGLAARRVFEEHVLTLRRLLWRVVRWALLLCRRRSDSGGDGSGVKEQMLSGISCRGRFSEHHGGPVGGRWEVNMDFATALSLGVNQLPSRIEFWQQGRPSGCRQMDQSSNRSVGTRLKSRVFIVRTDVLFASAIAAILRSCVPNRIRWRFRSSK